MWLHCGHFCGQHGRYGVLQTTQKMLCSTFVQIKRDLIGSQTFRLTEKQRDRKRGERERERELWMTLNNKRPILPGCLEPIFQVQLQYLEHHQEIYSTWQRRMRRNEVIFLLLKIAFPYLAYANEVRWSQQRILPNQYLQNLQYKERESFVTITVITMTTITMTTVTMTTISMTTVHEYYIYTKTSLHCASHTKFLNLLLLRTERVIFRQ